MATIFQQTNGRTNGWTNRWTNGPMEQPKNIMLSPTRWSGEGIKEHMGLTKMDLCQSMVFISLS